MATDLRDRSGRLVTYLRLSVTDRCDLRCHYCLPARPEFLPKHEVLTLEELLFLAQQFVRLGVSKIRITGGEPLVRKNVTWLLERVAALEGMRELVVTTNGTRLEGLAAELRALGVQRLNISLDSLRPDRFLQLTRNGDLAQVLRGIDAACAAGFKAIRLNTVLLGDGNSDEILDLIAFACERDIDISFIEEMPLGDIGRTRPDRAMTASDLLELAGQRYELRPSSYATGGPSQYWQVAGHRTRVGVIAPYTRNFCASCNRVRMTCTGVLHPCLGHLGTVSLAAAARAGDVAAVERLIRESLAAKPEGHEFATAPEARVMRYMATTGG